MRKEKCNYYSNELSGDQNSKEMWNTLNNILPKEKKCANSWINPLVVVEKPNGDIRICLDMRQANHAILREKHPVPTVKETLQEISEAKTQSSKLDLNMVFHQIELYLTRIT